MKAEGKKEGNRNEGEGEEEEGCSGGARVHRDGVGKFLLFLVTPFS